jgi:pSer/pThr/pTyr-binding forkhead associated (FHA) protein
MPPMPASPAPAPGWSPRHTPQPFAQPSGPPPMHSAPPQAAYQPPAYPAAAIATGPGQQAAATGPKLSVWYGGQRYTIDKDRFIIGRGKASCDLVVKDSNISRQHAMVEFVSGQYFVVDMGSTNGIEHQGQRISRKPVAEGDRIVMAGHELVFTYR